MTENMCLVCGSDRPHCKNMCKGCYRKHLYNTPKATMTRKNYYQKPEVKARMAAHQREYNKRPEVKEKKKIANKKYAQKQDVKDKLNVRLRVYRQTQRYKMWLKKYREKSYVRVKRKLSHTKYNKKDDVRIRKSRWSKIYLQKPEIHRLRKAYAKKFQSDRRKKDINYRLRLILSTKIRMALKGEIKSACTRQLIGCSIDQLKAHLEKQFKPGMTWKNYGLRGWHMDHIIPCKAFDLTNPEHQKACFHYTNIQPLWAKENLKKSGTLPMLCLPYLEDKNEAHKKSEY